MAKRPFLPATDTGPNPAGGASRTLIEHTYNALRNDIIEGRLEPGSKLRIEHLRTQYAVGASTLREAITRLASDALVTAEGQRGFRVAPITLEELADLTNLRVQIEIEALRQSIRHGDEAWRTRLREAYEAMSAFEQPIRPEHRRQWEALNVHFHETLLSGQNSPWTQKILAVLYRHSERYRRYSLSLETNRDVHTEHAAIYDMAMSGQEARAALALEAHIRTTPDLLARKLGERAFLRPPETAGIVATELPAPATAAPPSPQAIETL